MIGVSVVSREIDRGWSVEKKETSTRYTYTRDTVMTLNVVQAIRAKTARPIPTFPYKFREKERDYHRPRNETLATCWSGRKIRRLLIGVDDRHELQNRTVDVLPFVKVFRARVWHEYRV